MKHKEVLNYNVILVCNYTVSTVFFNDISVIRNVMISAGKEDKRNN